MPTVDDLRNEIRLAVGRFERDASTGFTKEELAAVSSAVGHEVDTKPLPGKAEMRATIRRAVEDLEGDADGDHDRPFRKAELEAIAATLEDA